MTTASRQRSSYSLVGNAKRKTITDASGAYHFDNVDYGFYVATSASYYSSLPPNEFSQLGQRTKRKFTAVATADSAIRRQRRVLCDSNISTCLAASRKRAAFNYWKRSVSRLH